MLIRWCRLVTEQARWVLVFVLLVTGWALTRIVDVAAVSQQRWNDVSRILIDPSIDSLLSDQDPGRLFYERVRESLGLDEALLLVLHGKNGVFEREFLSALLRTANRLEDDPSVSSVLSLANSPNIRGVDGTLEVGNFFDSPPANTSEVAEIRRDLRDNPVYSGTLVSEDERSTAVLVYLQEIPARELMLQQIDYRIRTIAQEEFGGHAEIWLTGGPHIKAETSRTMSRDLLVIVPLSFCVSGLIAFVFFRTLGGVVVPMLTIALALIWTLAAVAIVNPVINIVTVALPALILVIGFAYAVHVVSAYYQAVEEPPPPGSETRSPAALRGLQRVILPTLLTGLTTGIGFLALALSPLDAVRMFGIACALGVVCTTLSAIIFAPAALSLLQETPSPTRAGADPGYMDGLFIRLAEFDVRNRTLILLGGALIGLFCILSLPRITVSSNLADNFGADTLIKQSLEAARRELGAVDQIYMVLEAQERDAFTEPEYLRLLERLQTGIDTQPEVDSSTSLADYVKLLHRGFHDNDPTSYRVPDSRALVSQLLLFSSTEELERFTDSQRQLASIGIRIAVMNSSKVNDLVDRLDALLVDLPPGIRGQVTGNPVLVARVADKIAYGQAITLSAAFGAILVILSILFTSLRVGMIAMLPNVLPVLIYFGALAVSGIPLDLTTGTVACLVLGIAVDDTIHFLARFNVMARERADETASVRLTLLEVGRPITTTSIALCLGFLILSFSNLASLAQFGALSAFTLGIAWVADVTLTPALASGLRIVTLWDLLTVDLGEEPEQAIPLLHGLRPAQARVTALMLKLRGYPEGHRLIRAGDPAEGMFVVLEGRLSSSLQRDGHVVPLSVHDRGDVVGELGLLKGERTADVYCDTSVRLLWLDRKSLERLRRRYPWIGGIVYRNLSGIIAERLIRTTKRVA